MQYLKLINPRFILIHLCTCFFFALAARQLSFFIDFEFTSTIYKLGANEGLKLISNREGNHLFIGEILTWIFIAPILGIFVAFIISLTITLYKREFWLNSLLVLVLAILCNRFGLYNNIFVDTVFFAPGRFFEKYGLEYQITINGCLLTLLGLFLFFNKRIQKFIFRNPRPKKTRYLKPEEGTLITTDEMQKRWDEILEDYNKHIENGQPLRPIRFIIQHIIEKGYSKHYYCGSSLFKLLISIPEDHKINFTKTLSIELDEARNNIYFAYADWTGIDRSPFSNKKQIKWTETCQFTEGVDTFEYFLSLYPEWKLSEA